MHVGIIMDGNGRWARDRGLPRSAGHLAGAESVKRIVEAAATSAVSVLTLYAFSCDNWLRPRPEVEHLMRLLNQYLNAERARCIKNGVKVNIVGRRDRLDPRLVRAIGRMERGTATCDRLLLRLAVDYSGRQSIVEAAKRFVASNEFSCFERQLEDVTHSVPDVSSVDLLIRTGGERRLSDFLLWESAYAELEFSDTYWPDYSEQEFLAALTEFHGRDRRFGQIASLPVTDQALEA